MFEKWFELESRKTGIMPTALARPNELLRNTERAMAGQGYLEWARYMAAAELHRQVVDSDITSSDQLIDAYALCAARLAAAQDITQRAAENHLARALALRDRLPAVADMLKHGLVAAHHIHTIIARTDLIEGSEHMADIDRDIAEHLNRPGSWSKNRMRDMVDAIIFRRDPDLVREDRTKAKDNRGVWSQPGEHGMGELTAVLSAEDTAIIMQRLDKLADSVCTRDPRTKPQRMSDALFAITMAREFVCACPSDSEHVCTADIACLPGEHMISGVDVKIILHAIVDQPTLDGATANPGYLQGHGIISADHARDLSAHPHTTTRPLGHTDIEYVPAPEPVAQQTPAQEDSPSPAPARRKHGPTIAKCGAPQPSRAARRARARNKAEQPTPPPAAHEPALDLDLLDDAELNNHEPMVPRWEPLPTVQYSNHYRPSAVLDSFIRIRDLYCTWPGCNNSAFAADLDHTDEYDHTQPTHGGQTTPTGLKALCRFHHLLKTHTDWLDDQHQDESGRTCTTVITAEGRHYPGPAYTGDDLFPTLRHITWDTDPPRRPAATTPPTRTQPRTAAKHARRKQERERNRRKREAEQPPPY